MPYETRAAGVIGNAGVKAVQSAGLLRNVSRVKLTRCRKTVDKQ